MGSAEKRGRAAQMEPRSEKSIYHTSKCSKLAAHLFLRLDQFDQFESWCCVQGEKGDMGVEGEQGEKGEMGLKGKEGASGDPGLVGVRVSYFCVVPIWVILLLAQVVFIELQTVL